MPRPSSRPTGAVWRLLEGWQAEHPLRPNQRQMARLFEISSSLLSNWKYMDSLMQTDDIKLVSEKTGIPFGEVAAAAAEDAPMARAAAANRRHLDVIYGDDTVVELKGAGAVGELEFAPEQVGVGASERRAARNTSSVGRALRRRQDEAGEASQEIVTETDEEIIDTDERPRR